jgi:hypothetical protein
VMAFLVNFSGWGAIAGALFSVALMAKFLGEFL